MQVSNKRWYPTMYKTKPENSLSTTLKSIKDYNRDKTEHV